MEQIGEGSNGVVYSAEYKDKIVAVKVWEWNEKKAVHHVTAKNRIKPNPTHFFFLSYRSLTFVIGSILEGDGRE